jgi:hypothetical protein
MYAISTWIPLIKRRFRKHPTTEASHGADLHSRNPDQSIGTLKNLLKRMIYPEAFKDWRPLAMGLFMGSGLMACQKPTVSEMDLKVAGGELTSDFSGTYYAQIDTFVGGAPSGTIANVATLLDVGASSHKVLLVSLADAFRGAGSANSNGFLPVIDELSVRLYGDSGVQGSPVLTLEKLAFQRDGKLTGQIPVVFVGARLERVPGTYVSRLVSSQVDSVGSRVVDPSPLQVGSTDFRNVYSSFVMIAIPQSNLAQLASAKFISAESRPKEDRLAQGQLSMVGFGDMSKMTAERTIEVTKNQLRNAALVKPLNASPEGQTPLRGLTAASSQVTQQIWEVEGGGICGSQDGQNYDTGSAIYYRAQDGDPWQFVGFVSRTTTKSAGYMGVAICDQVAPGDLASLVISPSQSHISKISSQF